MKRVKGLLIAALLAFGASTASYAEPCDDVDQVQQIESLRSVYYRGGALPPDPSEAELESLRQLKAETELQLQASLLEDAFPGNEKLQAIAIRDHDGDGVKDYRITKCGEFRENDPDSDCDRVANVLDDSPYERGPAEGAKSCAGEPDWHEITNDHNSNGLPDQIDWRVLRASGGDEERAAEVQEGLYRDYKIVLVDRRVIMSPAMAVELDHVIREIFRGQIVPEFAPLRVIATDSPVCLEGDDFYGWASPETSTVSFSQETVDLVPILRLEILVHEMTHTLQYDMDFAASDVEGFRTRNRYDSDGFHAFARLLDWEAVPKSPHTPQPAFRLAVWHCDDKENDDPFTLTYRKKSGDEWNQAWDDFVANSTDPIWLNAQLKAEGMFSKYGFGSSWEWDAELTAAFVMNQLLDAAGRICTPDEADALSDRLHADIAGAEWEYVNENGRSLDSYQDVIAKRFHVEEATWDALSRHFLLGSYAGVCGG